MAFRYFVFLVFFLPSVAFSQTGYFANNKVIYKLDLQTGEVDSLFEADHVIAQLAINSKNELYALGVINYQAFLVYVDVHDHLSTILTTFPKNISFHSLAFDQDDNLFLSTSNNVNSGGSNILMFDFQTMSFVPSGFDNGNIRGYIAIDPTDNSLFFSTTCCLQPGSADAPGLYRVSDTGVIDTIALNGVQQAIKFDTEGNLYAFDYFQKFYTIDKESGETLQILPEKQQAPVSTYSGFDFEHPPFELPYLTSQSLVHDFGFVDHDHPVKGKIRLKNIGQQLVVIDSFHLAEGPFEVSAPGISFPVSLGLYETLELPVSFSSKETKYSEENIRVYWNDAQTLNYQLKGFSRAFSKAKTGVIYSFIEPHSIITLDSATYSESAPQKYPNIDAITHLSIDSKGNVYAISAGRLHLVDIESGEVQFIAGVNELVDATFFDADDNMYAWNRDETDNSNHFYRYDSIAGDFFELHQFTFPPDMFDDVDYVQSVTMDARERVIYFLSGDRGLYKLDLNLPEIKREFISGIFTIIDVIFFTDQGRLYGKGIFSDDGIYEICKENGNVQKIVDGNFYSYVSFAHRPTFANEFRPTSVCEEEEIVSGSADDLRMSHLLYPNPFTNVLNFTGSKIDNGPVSLYNLSGQKMGTLNEIESNGAFKVFSFASDQLAPGVYIVTATVDGKPFFAKVLKE